MWSAEAAAAAASLVNKQHMPDTQSQRQHQCFIPPYGFLILFVAPLVLQARLVALLREPVSRAMSSVNMLFQRSPLYDGLKENTPEYNRAWQQYVVTQLRK